MIAGLPVFVHIPGCRCRRIRESCYVDPFHHAPSENVHVHLSLASAYAQCENACMMSLGKEYSRLGTEYTTGPERASVLVRVASQGWWDCRAECVPPLRCQPYVCGYANLGLHMSGVCRLCDCSFVLVHVRVDVVR